MLSTVFIRIFYLLLYLIKAYILENSIFKFLCFCVYYWTYHAMVPYI